MVYRFGPHVLDLPQRELRSDDRPVAVQPQVFELLVYLVRNRDRVVSKEELLEALWPDAVVLEGSLQRAISQVRAALGDEQHALIRTYPRHGYRFLVDVAEEGGTQPATAEPPGVPAVRYARSGDVHLAYSTVGAGDVDIILVLGWTLPMRALFHLQEMSETVAALARLGRVVLFDKRGTGLSDRVKQLPALDQRMDDLRAVLDAMDSRRAVLIGISEGGPLAILFAAAHPERVQGLVLVGAFARLREAPGWPAGWSDARAERVGKYIRRAWGEGRTLLTLAPSRAADPRFRAWAARGEQEGASPGAALDLFEMNLAVDVRPLLETVHAPTVVLHHTGDAQIDVAQGRYLAERIPGARLIERPGDDHVFAFEDRHELQAAVAQLIASAPGIAAEGFLGTVLCVDDTSERASLAKLVASVGARFGAEPLAPDAAGACFTRPRAAVACGLALREALATRGRQPRLAIHAGEVVRTPSGVTGVAVEVASRLARRAAAGELWVSHVVADLVPGSGIAFEPRAPVSLGRRWNCFAVQPAPAPPPSRSPGQRRRRTRRN